MVEFYASSLFQQYYTVGIGQIAFHVGVQIQCRLALETIFTARELIDAPYPYR